MLVTYTAAWFKGEQALISIHPAHFRILLQLKLGDEVNHKKKF